MNAGTDPLNPDIVAPTVVAVDPPDDATNVPENRPVTATFSERLRAQSITSNTLRVLRAGTPVPGTVRLMPNGVDVVFTPNGLFEDNTQHDVIVAGRATSPATRWPSHSSGSSQPATSWIRQRHRSPRAIQSWTLKTSRPTRL